MSHPEIISTNLYTQLSVSSKYIFTFLLSATVLQTAFRDIYHPKFC